MHGVDPRGRRQRQQMLRHRKGAAHQIVGLAESVQEADLVEALGGEAEAKRHLHRDRVRQVGNVPVIVAAEQPAFGFRYLEHRAFYRDPQIGALDQHEAAAHRIAVDRGDDRFFQGAGHERVLDVGPHAAGLAALQGFLHVLAGTERPAGAGEDRDLEFIAAAELGPRLSEAGTHLVVERIEALGAIHPHHQDLPVALGFDDGHVFPLEGLCPKAAGPYHSPPAQGRSSMKIVVYGPDRRTGVLRDGSVVDLSGAFAKYAAEKNGEPHPIELAEALVAADLARLIEAGPLALDSAQQALDYLFGHAQDQKDPRGAALVYPAAAVHMHAPRPNGARIACAGGNFPDHAAAMAEKMQRKPYTGDARAQIRDAGSWGFW